MNKMYKATLHTSRGEDTAYGPTIRELIRYMLESGYKQVSFQEMTLEEALQQDDFSMGLFCDIFNSTLEDLMGDNMTFELFDDNSMTFGYCKVSEDGELEVDMETGFLISFSCPEEFFALYSAMEQS